MPRSVASQWLAGVCEGKDEFWKLLLTTESHRFILISDRESNTSAKQNFCEPVDFPIR